MIAKRVNIDDQTDPGKGKFFLYQDDWEEYTLGNWVETDYPEKYEKRMIRPKNQKLCFRTKELNALFGFNFEKGERYPFLMSIGGSDRKSNDEILSKRPVLSRGRIEKGDFTPIYYLDSAQS